MAFVFYYLDVIILFVKVIIQIPRVSSTSIILRTAG